MIGLDVTIAEYGTANLPEQLVDEHPDLFGEASARVFIMSRTFLLSIGVFVGAWVLGLAIVPFQGGLTEIDAGTLWSTTFIVYLGVTIFAAFRS